MSDSLDAVLEWVPKMVTRYRAATHPDYDDAVQEARAAAFLAWHSADTSKSPRDFYARRKANWKAVEFVSGRTRPLSIYKENSGKHVTRLVLTDDGAEPDASVAPSFEDAILDSMMIAPLLDSLDDRQRELVHRRFWRGETAAEISAGMGMSQSWVSSQWLTIRNSLAVHIGAPVKPYAGRGR